MARVIDGLEGASAAVGGALDRGAIERLLAGLRSRVFLLHNAHDDGHVLFHTRWAMSYLRGPLTRQQIKRLSPSSARPAVDLPHEARPGREVAASGNERPVLPPGIDEVFVGDAQGTYFPHLVASLSLHYKRASYGLDTWEEYVILAPLDEESPWESAELSEPGTLEVVYKAPSDAEFVAPPSGSVGKARFRSHAKQIKNHFYQNRPKILWRCKALKLRSKPDETKAEFAARVQLANREKRDAAVDKLRERFAKEVQRMDERLRRAETRVDREKSQYDQQKLQTGISMGATVLGALFGGRGMGRATSAARGAGRVARERDDVRRAEQEVRDLEEARRALEVDVEEEVRALQADLELDAPEVEEVIVRPTKADIQVSELKLAWKRE